MYQQGDKTKKIKLLLILVVIGVLCSLIVIYAKYRNAMNRPDGISVNLSQGGTLSIKKISQTATRNGVTEWTMKADYANYSEFKNEVVLDNISIVFFLENGEQLFLKALKGVLHTASRDIEVSGDVVLNNEKYQLKTERMDYKHEKRIISSDRPVEITGPAVKITADTLFFDLNTRRTSLAGSVKGNFNGSSIF
ncbi:MAG: LPS export ABC transporter periplasmic protein LptC [Desulfobacteraceae bacterium 4572_123]|nr:MAG: LPS export ABC transporter periplasmic protein LptC [Desulfobacteraceae bacterium 4572_123]